VVSWQSKKPFSSTATFVRTLINEEGFKTKLETITGNSCEILVDAKANPKTESTARKKKEKKLLILVQK